MFGERLKSLRKKKGLTIEQVAEMLELGRSTYAGYETEGRKPQLETIIKLAQFYNTSADYILGLTDNPQSREEENNFKSFIEGTNLTWDGIPLTEKELEHIKDLLEIIVRDRLPKRYRQ